jgi:glyoxylase-like metal-dependent hydrolase (beta-lactamase superfamily II)
MTLRIERVLAPNPGPFTGAGTNTWILDSGGEVLVIDPGPVINAHRQAIEDTVGDRRIRAVLVSHTHPDHAPLANPLAAGYAVPAIGYGPGPDFDPDEMVDEGSHLPLGSEDLLVVHTPGHSGDHLCFLAGRVLFTGDHIIGGSSVMVEDMSAYMASLEKVAQLELDRLCPGHGEEMDRPREVIAWYLAHRRQRELEILDAVRQGAASVPEVVEVVYRAVDRSLHPLASRSVAAHLEKLTAEGLVTEAGGRLTIAEG